MHQRPVYAITETNVDGCGSTATEYIYTDRELTEEQLTCLKTALANVKASASDKCYDTETIINEALQIPELSDLHPELGGSPLAGEILF